jgi:hypothetical protein
MLSVTRAGTADFFNFLLPNLENDLDSEAAIKTNGV